MKHQIQSIAVGLVTLAILAFGVYAFIALLVDKLNSLNSDLSKTLIGAVVTILGAIITFVVGKYFEQRMRIEQELRLKKVPVYEEQIKVMFNILFAEKRGMKPMSGPAMIKAFSVFTEKLIVWGGSPVIKAYEEFKTHQWLDGDKQASILGFVKFEAFLKALRKDLGNDNSKLKDGDLLRLFITDLDEASKEVKKLP